MTEVTLPNRRVLRSDLGGSMESLVSYATRSKPHSNDNLCNCQVHKSKEINWLTRSGTIGGRELLLTTQLEAWGIS